ncbi:glutathione S-transferase T3-like [Brassica napus]|uniref:glutathione S-transferase T3-like n=1 Tax=Brassica napus TaxID=3708 RepID=UPI0006AA93CF|nr:glutathione S-transferase T3-like [Brassica napus]
MNLPATLSVDLLEDEKPPSLSRRLTSMKNHFTSFSGPELSSRKSKRKMDGWIKRQKSKVNVGKEVQCNRVFGDVSDSVSLSSSQVPFLGSQGTEDSYFDEDTQASRKERTWTLTDDVVLISFWLNTSKDPVVGNEQRSLAFWKRIVAYFSPTKSSSPAIKKKCTLEHAWKELRNDQKWCELSTAKNDGSSKKRKCGDCSHSASSKANEEDSADDDEGTNHPPGVKAAKARSKKTIVDEELCEFQTMWSIKKHDLALKERLSKIKLLDNLIAKQGPLADYEEALKKKLINELMSN